MSAIFRAEIDNLMRLVRRAELESQASHNERERIRIHVEKRARRLHELTGRMAKVNRADVLACLKKHASEKRPLSANKVGEMTGLKDDTTRKHLREMAKLGEIVAVESASGKQVRYYAKGKA